MRGGGERERKKVTRLFFINVRSRLRVNGARSEKNSEIGGKAVVKKMHEGKRR